MAAAVLPAKMMPLSKPSMSAPTGRSPQIIEDRYIDDDKLLQICRERFGVGNYHLKVRGIHLSIQIETDTYQYKFNRWYLLAPDWLDEVSPSTTIAKR